MKGWYNSSSRDFHACSNEHSCVSKMTRTKNTNTIKNRICLIKQLWLIHCDDVWQEKDHSVSVPWFALGSRNVSGTAFCTGSMGKQTIHPYKYRPYFGSNKHHWVVWTPVQNWIYAGNKCIRLSFLEQVHAKIESVFEEGKPPTGITDHQWTGTYQYSVDDKGNWRLCHVRLYRYEHVAADRRCYSGKVPGLFFRYLRTPSKAVVSEATVRVYFYHLCAKPAFNRNSNNSFKAGSTWNWCWFIGFLIL